jgi:hypothetical protein
VSAQQLDGLSTVIHLTASDKEIQGQAQFTGEQMNLGCQTSSAQCLVGASFLRPLAACW